MGNPNAAHEPSMEEILASIRQIISDDGEQAQDDVPSAEAQAAGPDHSHADEAQSQAADRHGGGEEGGGSDKRPAQPNGGAAAAPAPARSPDAPEPQNAGVSLERQSGPAPVAESDDAATDELATETPTPAKAVGEREKIAAGGAFDVAASAVNRADDRRLLSPQADASVSGAFSALAHTILAQNARTLEDLVSEMLRPMLKDWLDDNLPPLVERLVKEEIERVSRGRR